MWSLVLTMQIPLATTMMRLLFFPCLTRRKKRNGQKKRIPTFKKPSVKKEVRNDDVCFIDLTDDDIPPVKLHGNTTEYSRTSSTESCLSDETYVSSDTQGSTQPGYPFSDPGTSTGYPFSETEETEGTEGTDDIIISETEKLDVYNATGLSWEAFATAEGDRIAKNISRGKPFPIWLFDDKK